MIYDLSGVQLRAMSDLRKHMSGTNIINGVNTYPKIRKDTAQALERRGYTRRHENVFSLTLFGYEVLNQIRK